MTIKTNPELGAEIKRVEREMKEKMEQMVDQMTNEYRGLRDTINSIGETINNMGLQRRDSPTQSSDISSVASKNGDRKYWDRIQMPIFKEGGDMPPRSWVRKMNDYFRINMGRDSVEKVQLAGYQLEGTAYDWFQYWIDIQERKKKVVCWDEFCDAFLMRFDNIWNRNYFTQLTSLKQKGPVADYCAKFQELAPLVPDIPEEKKVELFVGNLQPDIQMELMMQEHKDLDKAIKQARCTEARNEAILKKQRYVPPPMRSSSTQQSIPTQQQYTQPPKLPVDNISSNHKGTRKLSDIEMEECRRKNLCFWCKNPFQRGHKCAQRKLFSLVLEGEDEENNLEVEEDSNLEEALPLDDLPSGSGEQLKLSLQALSGVPDPQTLRIKGHIKGQKIFILVDSGSTHNFINTNSAKQLNLFMRPVKNFSIAVADGGALPCDGICHQTKISLGSYELTTDLFGAKLGGVHLVLGVQWLRTLGDVIMNFETLCMKFTIDGQTHQLDGVQTPALQIISAHRMEKTLRKEGGGFVMRLCNIEGKLTEPASEQLPLDLQQVLKQHSTVLCHDHIGMPPHRDLDHAIELIPGTTPVNVRARRHPFMYKEVIEQQVQELLSSGMIQPSKSPFAAPVVLTMKKDGSFRMCVDYRELNKVTVKNRFPMPLIDDLLDELYGAKFFSKIDLKSGYHQIRIREKDVDKTAFRTHQGLYEFRVMPFGLCNAPATFQALMNKVLSPWLRKGVLVFFDDILIYSSTWDDHLRLLSAVLLKLSQEQLYANRKKCFFGRKEIEYLGHIISEEGVRMDPKKVQTILDWPVPDTILKLRAFLGLCGYYRRFVKGYAHITAPLTDLLKKDAFHWSPKAQDCFQMLKERITTAPILRAPDFSKPFTLECDASGKGLGAVLMQDHHPIAFESRKFKGKELLKSTYDKEMLAIIHALAKWRQYLLGSRFIVLTDHNSLKYMLDQQNLSTEQQKWVSKIQAFDFIIQYKRGKDNVVADALSRKEELHAISIITPAWVSQVQEAYESHPSTKGLTQGLISADTNQKLTYNQGLLWYKGRIFLPPNCSFQLQVLKEAHDSPAGGHAGFLRTYHKIKESFFWKGMKADIGKYIASCNICQRIKTENILTPGLLQPLPVPNQKWESISMDFITGLPNVGGKDSIFVVVDRLTKYAHFTAISNQSKASQVAAIFLQEIYRLHGLPKEIISDRDSRFTSSFWKELFTQLNTSLAMSTSYHPQTDGQTEVVNRTLEGYLRSFVMDRQKQWIRWLHLAEWWYNSTFHTTIQMSPFEALYGYKPPQLLDWYKFEGKVQTLNDSLQQTETILRSLKARLEEARNRMKQQADRHRSEREFQQGDWVYLRLQPYKQASLRTTKGHKLGPRYYGPFRILRRIGETAYHLDLPGSTKLHPVFHVSRLKKHIGEGQLPASSLPPVNEEGQVNLIPEKILQRRDKQLRHRTISEFLIKWADLPIEEATWEDSSLVAKWPNLCYEDAAHSSRGDGMI